MHTTLIHPEFINKTRKVSKVYLIKQSSVECFSDGTRARLRIPVGELNDLAGSRRNLHLRGEQPRWIPGESFLLRERRSLWRRQGPGNYFTIYLCPPVMDYPYLLLLPTTTTTTTITTTITTTALLICACACTSQHCI